MEVTDDHDGNGRIRLTIDRRKAKQVVRAKELAWHPGR
jgi:hypothetical protein